MKFRLLLAAATCLALPLAAHAQPVTGPYIGLEAGATIANPVDNNLTATDRYAYRRGNKWLYLDSYSYGVVGKILLRAGAAEVASVGYGFGNGFRVQLDGDFLRNTFAKFDGNFFNSGYESENGHVYDSYYDLGGRYSGKASGIETTYGPMLNGLYDMNVGLPIFPYVGGGIGYQWTDVHSTFLSDYTGKTDSTKGSFAFDLIGGVSYPLPQVPGLSVTAEYRFMMLTATRDFGKRSETEGEDTYTYSATLGQISSHTFLLGLRYQLFNPPAAAPAVAPMAAAPVAAAPAPAPARTYLVFFDWDKASLTPRATQIIAQAASDSKTQSTTSLDVSGYTDTSGTPVYNQGLSLRRAKAVAGQLVTDGVPASEIEIHAYGETHLLVPTGPGVREPQNRRVEIVLQ